MLKESAVILLLVGAALTIPHLQNLEEAPATQLDFCNPPESKLVEATGTVLSVSNSNNKTSIEFKGADCSVRISESSEIIQRLKPDIKVGNTLKVTALSTVGILTKVKSIKINNSLQSITTPVFTDVNLSKRRINDSYYASYGEYQLRFTDSQFHQIKRNTPYSFSIVQVDNGNYDVVQIHQH